MEGSFEETQEARSGRTETKELNESWAPLVTTDFIHN